MNGARYTVLGVFFFSVLIILGIVTIYLGEINPFEEEHEYRVYFSEVNGLRAGDPVLVYGVQLGRVDDINFSEETEPARRLEVLLVLTRALPLREDYEVLISATSLLGGKRVEILLGEGQTLAANQTQLQGHVRKDMTVALEELISDNETDLHRLLNSLANITEQVANQEKAFTEFLLEKSGHDALHDTLDNLSSVTKKLDTGDGAIARLINEGGAYDKLMDILDRGSAVLGDLTEGEGTLGKLIREPEVYDNLKETMESLKRTVTRVEAGEGAAGWALSAESDEFVKKLDRIVDNIVEVTDGLREGRGVAGRLLNDPEMEQKFVNIATDFEQIVSDVRTIVEDVQHGRGIAGLLLTDDEARRDMRRIVDMLLHAIEDAREAAPVSSFASFLFGQL